MKKSLYTYVAIATTCLSLSTAYSADRESVRRTSTSMPSLSSLVKTAAVGLSMALVPAPVKADIYGSEFVGCYRARVPLPVPSGLMQLMVPMGRISCTTISNANRAIMSDANSMVGDNIMVMSFEAFKYPDNRTTHSVSTILNKAIMDGLSYNVYYDVALIHTGYDAYHHMLFKLSVYASNISYGNPPIYKGVTKDTYTQYDNQAFAIAYGNQRYPTE